MADKTVKELAAMTKRPLKQLIINWSRQGCLRAVTMTSSPIANNKTGQLLQQSHGQNDKPRISLKSKTTSTARG